MLNQINKTLAITSLISGLSMVCGISAHAGNVVAPSEDPAHMIWPNQTVHWMVAPDIQNATGADAQQIRDNIRAAIALWDSETVLTFKELTSLPAKGHPGFLKFSIGNTCTANNWNYTGSYRIGRPGYWGDERRIDTPDDTKLGVAGITLTTDCAKRAETIAHEIGHRLGLLHEHQRRDRNEHVTVTPPANIDNNSNYSDTLYTVISGEVRMVGPYDFDSIMHYSARSAAVLPKYNAFKNSPGYHGDLSLSQGDIDTINVLYGDAYRIRSGDFHNACLSAEGPAWPNDLFNAEGVNGTMDVTVATCDSTDDSQKWFKSQSSHGSSVNFDYIIAANGMCLSFDQQKNKPILEFCHHEIDDESDVQIWWKPGRYITDAHRLLNFAGWEFKHCLSAESWLMTLMEDFDIMSDIANVSYCPYSFTGEFETGSWKMEKTSPANL